MPAMTFFSAILTSIVGVWLSSLVRVISAEALLAASSVALIWSLPASETLSQELRALVVPEVEVKLRATVQEDETSSFHEATDWSPIFNSLPEMVTAGPAMTFTVLLETVMTGAWVSFSGVTGVTGVEGSGSGLTGSGPPQEMARATARSTARR